MSKDYMYIRIYQEIKNQILRGDFKENSKLPTEAELQKIYGVSRITVKKALDALNKENLIQRFPGRGTFACPAEESPATVQVVDVPQVHTPKQKTIGVVAPRVRSSFGADILSSIGREAAKENCNLMMGIGYASQEEEDQLIEQLIQNGCSGIIVLPVHRQNNTSGRGIMNMAVRDYPAVLVDRVIEGIPLPYVGSDHEEAAEQIMQHLFSLGHEAVGLISEMPLSTAAKARERGYLRGYAMTNYRVHPEYILHDLFSTTTGQDSQENVKNDVERVKQYYTENPEVTAILCMNYSVARICKQAAAELGIRIPEDMSLACFDIPEEDGFFFPEYTHIHQNEDEIGRKAVNVLLSVIDGKEYPQEISVPTQLIIGASTETVRSQE